ncbi:hypothetical protein HYV72_02060 [Candidatus Uhrbacteria bacterium]|nr:hypothetical protein [Candidatus Uhrbacteria bacterium]
MSEHLQGERSPNGHDDGFALTDEQVGAMLLMGGPHHPVSLRRRDVLPQAVVTFMVFMTAFIVDSGSRVSLFIVAGSIVSALVLAVTMPSFKRNGPSS